jgi:hypothetical protein
MIRRPPSYSDSFLVLSGGAGGLTPLVRSTSVTSLAEPLEEPPIEMSAPALWPRRVAIFIFKGSLHVLFISAFETAFYFLYVNRSENAGIIGTINTYYGPLVQNCAATWSNTTRWFVQELLANEVDQTAIDAAGAAAASGRAAYNHQLLVWSSLYSVICFGVCVGIAAVTRWRRWEVPWGKILLENFLFIVVLGLYEAFFFRTIIYNYDTISTAELNAYLVDGLATCATG